MILQPHHSFGVMCMTSRLYCRRKFCFYTPFICVPVKTPLLPMQTPPSPRWEETSCLDVV